MRPHCRCDSYDADLKKKYAEMLSRIDEQIESYLGRTLNDEALTEYERMAGILGMTVAPRQAARGASKIITADFQSAKWSDRLWTHQAALKVKIDELISQAIIAGKNSHQLAKELEKTFGVSEYQAVRLMHTECKRVRTEIAFDIMNENGNTEYIYLALGNHPCPICSAINGNVYKIKDATAGSNKPPMHPNCECSTAPHWDEEKYRSWMDSGAAANGVQYSEYDDGNDYLLRNNLPKGFNDERNIGEPITQVELERIIDIADKNGVQIGTVDNKTGGFENYCGDVDVIVENIESLGRSIDRSKNTHYLKTIKKPILIYDNVLGYEGDKSKIDIEVFIA